MIKKVIKKLAKSENITTFAMSYNTGSGATASNDSGFFLSVTNHIGYNTPSLWLNGSTAPSECRTEGKVIPFFYSIKFNKYFYSVMSYTENNVFAKNNSTCTNTHGKGEILPPFTKATAFIFLLFLLFMLHTCTAGRVALSHFQNGSL